MVVRLVTIGGFLILVACNQTGAGGPFWEMFTGGRTVDRIPLNWLELCQHTIAAQARPHGATLVEAAGADTPTRLPNGLTEAIIDARITYERRSLRDVREARVTCRLSEEGRVLEVL